jgi:hypothetical protein
MTLHETIDIKQRFQLGKVVITLGALSHCENNNIDYLGLTIRHAIGDFGIVGHLDNVKLTHSERQHGEYVTYDWLKLNAIAIESQQGKVLSIYSSPENRDANIWIQTLFDEKEMQTTILLPCEYHNKVEAYK